MNPKPYIQDVFDLEMNETKYTVNPIYDIFYDLEMDETK